MMTANKFCNNTKEVFFKNTSFFYLFYFIYLFIYLFYIFNFFHFMVNLNIAVATKNGATGKEIF